ncbi:hypothetical protein GGP41_010508 [Bipolaris sorokiniana]|uniref:Rrn9 domain-containing protein n=2 Tax=Cochliobolus sativus TaxID=45130 RepID=A0A8H6DWA9_COCSA|nr:uncharacterized protein COCSADRAFT_35678 [Bipolaris sorokiniana ND90Pr]EMD65637.1 hypothetical protein COCSADRAFT_35678 [Bipolaris sorokiniana ND90Pr]KAF5850846.1 hypothetical protein GGP41_010508 [Bipolaris sorokiniana]
MSLFGGDSAKPWLSSYESDTSESSFAPSSPPVIGVADVHDAQKAQPVNTPVQIDVDDDIVTDADSSEDEYDESDEEDEDEEPARPNRFHGTPQTWEEHTEADRRITESLEQMENTNLSAHLYNAHMLKRRLRRPAQDLARLKMWQSKDEWLMPEKDLKYTDAAGLVQDAIVPPPDWTAWPVPPTELPDYSEKLDSGLVRGQADEWAIKSTSKQDAGEELREELLAVFLRIAKDQWNMRDVSSSASDADDDPETSRSRSPSEFARLLRPSSASRADAETKAYSGAYREAAGHESNKDQTRPYGKKRGRKKQLDTFTKPVILADDAKAQQLLQPSIQSIMNKLDDLALAICRMQLNQIRDENSAGSSMSEFTSGAESTGRESRPLSRARSRTTSSRRRPRTRSSSRASLVRANRVVEQSTQDKDTNAMDSDATSGGASDWEASSQALGERKRRRPSGSVSDAGSIIEDEEMGRGLMDWSEVLGLAAVRGWDKAAVARTAQRCAALFGESMSFIPYNESLASQSAPKPIWYTPSTPAATSLLSSTKPPASEHPLSQFNTLRCPHTDCYAHEYDFESPNRVAEHCYRVHGYDPNINDAEKEEKVTGCVHIDGFLQPITEKPGCVRHGRETTGNGSKKQSKGKDSSLGALETAVSAEE